MQCIYCGSDTEFNTEHVIPKFLGSFTNCPTIPKKKRLICKECNSTIFSGLESNFKEDSQEGIVSQMLNTANSNSIRIRGENAKLVCDTDLGDNLFFNDMFPFLIWMDESFKVDPKNQIKIKNFGGEQGFQVFAFEALHQAKHKPDAFEDLKKRLKNTGIDNMRIFTQVSHPDDRSKLDEGIQLLKEYGVNYNEKETQTSQISHENKVKVRIEAGASRDVCRFVAKIAFNYFIYCCLEARLKHLLAENHFDNIKKFILGDKNIDTDFIKISNIPITYNEAEDNKRFLGYMITVFQEDGYIYSKVSFLGGPVYQVLIGEAHEAFRNDRFGCGHLFYPFDHSIHILSKTPPEETPQISLKDSFKILRD